MSELVKDLLNILTKEVIRCGDSVETRKTEAYFLANRLTDLGYVKVVRCGECKWWVRCECPECRKSKSPIMACGNPDIIDISVRGEFDYCSAGEAKEDTNA